MAYNFSLAPLVAHVAKKPAIWNQLWRQKQLTRIVSEALVAFTGKADPSKPQLHGLYRVSSSMKSCGEQTDQQVN